MDKHWKDVKVGDIIEIKHYIRELQLNLYYKLCEGEFTTTFCKFYGKYFKRLGSDHENFVGKEIVGFETLDYEYKIIDKLPDNLYK